MANGDDNNGGILGNLLSKNGLSTLIQVASLAAVIYAQWSLMGRSISDLTKTVDRLQAQVNRNDSRLYAIESQEAQIELRLKWLEARQH